MAATAEEKRELERKAEERRELKKKVAAHKSWLTRVLRDTENAAGRFGPKPNDEQAVSLQTCSAQLDKRYWALQGSMVAYQEVCEDEAEMNELGVYADTAQDSYGKMKADVDKLLS